MPEQFKVFQKYADIPYITREKSKFIYDIIKKNKPELCLELGFYHGKSSAVIAQALEENGSGRLITMDMPSALERSPNIKQILSETELSQRVDIVTDQEGFHWSLMDLLERQNRPMFDFAYIDGAHTWEGTGFSLLLLERMLNPSAWLVFDDVNWTLEKSNQQRSLKGERLIHPNATERQATTAGVRKVFELLCAKPAYGDQQILSNLNYGICRKK